MADLHPRHLRVLKAIRGDGHVNPEDAEELNGTLIEIGNGTYSLTVVGRRALQAAEIRARFWNGAQALEVAIER